MDKYSRLGKNTVLIFIGNIGAKLIGLLMLPFYTRWLSLEEYGTMDILIVYTTLLLGIVTCNIYEAIFIYPKNQSFDKQSGYFTSGLLFLFISLLFAAVIFGGLKSIFFSTLHFNGSFIRYMWLIYGMLVSMAFQQYLQQFIRSINLINIYSMMGGLQVLLTVLFSFLFVPQYHIKGFLFTYILSNALTALISGYWAKLFRYISLSHIRLSYCTIMLKYSLPLIPNGIMWWLVTSINRPLIEKEIGLDAIGILAVSNKFPALLSMFISIFSISWQISVLEEYGKSNYDNFYNRIFRGMVMTLILLSSLLAVCSSFLVELFVDKKFYDAQIYIPILSLSIIFMCISNLSGSNFSAIKKSKYYFYSSIWAGMVAIVLNFILIPTFGLLGASLAIVFSFLVAAISRVMYAWKYIQIQKISHYFFCIFMNVCIIITMGTNLNWIAKMLICFSSIGIIFYVNKTQIHYLYAKLFSLIK